jgi:beta-apo-4'-carotenal oxygenase
MIASAYNCPIQLTFGPLIGAIAAGNTALIKPSEQAASVAMVLQKILVDVMDPECYICIQGGVPETTALLKQTWDKIFYTGGTKVGKIIAKKAAETLTPVTLELGGKNPAIVTKNADIKLAARRLLWAKVNNAGQICTSQNYALVDREVIAAFVEGLKIAMNDFFPEGAKASVDFGRIINHTQWKRLDDSIKKSNGKTIIHGLMDEIDRLIEPTVVEVTDISDNLIAEENFGPIFPILAVDGLDHAIKLANQIDSTPLAAYPFGTKQETDRILQECRSGGASVNDGFIHSAIPTLQFGGIGQSGQGAYRGKESFDCFTHRRSVTTTPGWAEGLISVRYPPYKNNLTKIQRMTNLKPNFDRDGSVISWLGYALSWITTIEDGGSSR